jgi:choline dehydrogenase-like flavoprotein
MYDVCVIGSGPAGGVLSKELAEGGAKVALVEAGRLMRPEEYHYHAWPYEFSNRHKPKPPSYPEEVTSSIRYENCDNVGADRIRTVGGRSIHWNAAAFRFAERDFREWSLSGVEADWPISYQELAPFYSYVERMVGVCGTREGLEIVPDGDYPMRPPKFRCSEQIVAHACAKLGIRMIPVRKALNTQPYDDRPPCHYCGHCMDGCDVHAIFTTPTSMFPKAEKTGNFTLIPERMAREIKVDREGRAVAVSVINTVTRQEEEIRAKAFAVCCATIESPRLLLNSKSPQFPNGLANSSDLVGRYLTGHGGTSHRGYIEQLIGAKPINDDGALDHSFIPRCNIDGRKRDYPGGWQWQLQFAGVMFPFHAQRLHGFGAAYKKQVRELQPGLIFMGGFGKLLAQPQNRVTVDPKTPDAYGIPVPVVHFRFSESDRAMFKEMVERGYQILETAKCRTIFTDSDMAGFGSHEGGTCRMGNDPKQSVLNRWCQSHDVKNLFVVDGSCFTTYPEKNPTLTIMALAVRTARYMRDQARQGTLG